MSDKLRRVVCRILCSLHLLALAFSTYFATIEIESILVSGLVCSVTGLAAGISALVCRQRILAAVSFLTPVIAVVLFFLEAFVLHLGPMGAAFPFCVIFIINQLMATVAILVAINALSSPTGKVQKQISIRTLLISMFGFSVFFAIARQVLKDPHSTQMALALGLVGLTCVGLLVNVTSVVQLFLRSPKRMPEVSKSELR